MHDVPGRRVFAFIAPRWAAFIVVAGSFALTARQLLSLAPQGPLIDFIANAVVALFVIGLFLGVCTRVYRYFNRRQVREDRRIFAADLLPYLNAGNPPPPYSLFLRPFFTDDRLTINLHDGDINAHIYGDQNSIEAIISDALDRTFPTVTIGNRGDTFGPGEVIVSDKVWQDAFHTLAKGAGLIFIYPFAQPATALEIGYLKSQGYLKKTVFIVPPLKGKLKGAFLGRPVTNLRGIYEISRDDFRKEGLEMPDVGDLGGVFLLNDDGRLGNSIKAKRAGFFLPQALGSALNSLSGMTLYDPKARPAVARRSKRRVVHRHPPKRRRRATVFLPEIWPPWFTKLAGYTVMFAVVGVLALIVAFATPFFTKAFPNTAYEEEVAEIALREISEAEWSCVSSAQLRQRLEDRGVGSSALLALAGKGNVRAQVMSAHDVMTLGPPPENLNADAVKLSKAASDQGDPRGKVTYALLLERSNDYALSRKFLEEAVKTGNIVATVQLGRVLSSAPQTAVEGKGLLDRGVQSGCPMALTVAATVIIEQSGDQVGPEARSMLERAAALDEPAAQFALAKIYLLEYSDRAGELITSAARNGSVEAKAFLEEAARRKSAP